MSKPQGLFRRGNVWYYRRRVPLDLVESFSGKSELKKSLGTELFAQAKTRRNLEAAKLEASFDAARAKLNGGLGRPSAAPAQADVVAAIRNYVSSEDAKRAESFGRVDWANDPEGTADAVAEVTGLVSRYKDPSHDATAQGVSVAATEIFGTHDRILDNWELLQRAILEVERRDLARMKGDYSRASFDHLFSTQSSEPPRRASITLGDLVEQYRIEYSKTKSVGAKRFGKVFAALDLIIRYFGADTELAEIDRAKCREFRDLLNQLPSNMRKHFPNSDITLPEVIAGTSKRNLGLMARETQDTYFNALKRLLDWAKREGHVEHNRADGLSPLRLKTDNKEARDPFNVDQLAKIFNASLYPLQPSDATASTAPTKRNQDAQFWIPLLGLFTGMRLNEICQLDVADIRHSDGGIPYIDVNDEGSDKLLKTTSSTRQIPIHPALIEVGFLEFVERQKQRSAKLFSELKLSSRGYHSEQVSRWFDRTFLPKVGAKTRTTSFHSFRHSFRDALRAINAPPAVVEGLGGWRMEKGVSGDYGSGLPVDQLAKWMRRIRYAGLDLSHLCK